MFNEINPKKKLKTEEVVYDPAHFIRCHDTGKPKNRAFWEKSQVWDVSFEPDVSHPEKTTNLIATCGGNSICVTNILTGEVLMKYRHKNKIEIFYTITWTVLPNELGGKNSVLVSGSLKGEICMFQPEDKVCFYVWPFTRSLTKEEKIDPKRPEIEAINSIVFHSQNSKWLFIGLACGFIYLYDIGSNFILPEYSKVDPQELLKLEPHMGEIYNIIWTGNNSQWLMAGSKAGLIGWKIDEDMVLDRDTVYTPITVDFHMPKHEKGDVTRNGSTVDSLDVLNDYTIVCKCVAHGLLYVIDLTDTILELDRFDDKVCLRTEKEAKIVARLGWSKTDNFYMNMGCNRQGLICCGDDQGSLWVYNQPALVKRANLENSKFHSEDASIIEANVILMWPDLQGDHLTNNAETPQDERCNIIVDKVVVSHDSEYIVAVTSNNMVCTWKRIENMYNIQEGWHKS